MARYQDGNCPRSTREKVKTGCGTCKLRKVKCDEEKPVCRRCQSSGRICDGYGIWGGGSIPRPHQQASPQNRDTKAEEFSRDAQASLIKTPPLIPLPASEQYCFEWYMYRSAVKLPGAFRSDYWISILFQASTAEPAIRHAVLALGSAHIEEVQGASRPPAARDDRQTLFTVSQCNKAIKQLQPCFSDGGKTSVRITLTTCVLFIYMEFLRGNCTKALVHLQHGLSLLEGMAVGVDSQDPSSMYLDGWLVTLFTRLLVQAKLLGQILRFQCQSFLGASFSQNLDTFRSIHHARRVLEHIMLRTFDLQETARQLAATEPAKIDSSLLAYQEEIQCELQISITTLRNTLRKFPSTLFSVELVAYHLLRPYYSVAVVLAGSCLHPSNELIFDRHEADFLDIILRSIETSGLATSNRLRSIAPRQDHNPASSASVSDIGWIAPLYFTATKCRNHRIRHQAVKLLQSTQHKEGIWSAPLAVVLAHEIIKIEEGNFYDHLVNGEFHKLAPPTDKDLATPRLPEELRLIDVNIVLPDDRAGKLLLSCRRKERCGGMTWISREYDLPSRQWNDLVCVTQSSSACREHT